MSKPIKIRIDGISGVSGTEIGPTTKEAIFDLSIQLKLSMNDIKRYKNKQLTVEDLNEILEKRI